MPFLFRRPTLTDAQMLLDWRTSPEIASKMATQVPYDIEKQKAWLTFCGTRQDYRHFIIMLEEDRKPIGYVSYSHIDWQKRECSIGHYTVLEKNKRHLAAYLLQFLSDYCFHELKMTKMYSSILKSNTRMIEKMKHLKIPLKKEDGGNLFFEHNISDFLKYPRLFPLARTLSSFQKDTLGHS